MCRGNHNTLKCCIFDTKYRSLDSKPVVANNALRNHYTPKSCIFGSQYYSQCGCQTNSDRYEISGGEYLDTHPARANPLLLVLALSKWGLMTGDYFISVWSNNLRLVWANTTYLAALVIKKGLKEILGRKMPTLPTHFHLPRRWVRAHDRWLLHRGMKQQEDLLPLGTSGWSVSYSHFLNCYSQI